jgi:hypothetical protein
MADKTPQPSAAKRPAGPHPAPRRVGEQIIFYCPNGDRIVVAAALGGKTGLCTKCHVQVSIPAIEPAPATATAEPAPADMQAGFPRSVPDEAPAPASDVGPLLPDAQPRDAAPAAAPVDWDLVAGQSVAAVIPELANLDATAPGEPFIGPAPGPGDHHPAARLVARLWQERAHGGIIELHMAGGSVILPEWYEVNWSRGTHGLFASQAADGTVTMTAVAWETLEKIVVRQVRDLPQGFE